MKILVSGYEHFCRKIVADLSLFDPAGRFKYRAFDRKTFVGFLLAGAGADLIYLVGGDLLCRDRKAFFLRFFLWLGRRIIVHWTGSDVTAIPGPLPSFFRHPRLSHLCESEWIRKELEAEGITAKIAALVGVDLPSVCPAWPGRFTVLGYVPEGRGGLYGLDRIVTLARCFPHIQFRIMGSPPGPDFPENVEAIGWTDRPEKEMSECVCYLRLNRHDGLSVSVLEALSLGRYVAYTMPLEGCFHAERDEGLRKYLARLEAAFRKGGLEPNEAGRRFVRRVYGREKVCAGLLAEFGAALRKEPSR